MKFKLDFELEPQRLISDFSSICMFGSCFAEYQAENFKKSGFPVYHNPFGIAYNPISIAQQIERIATQTPYTESDFTEHNSSFFTLEHHGSFKYKSLAEALNTSNSILKNARNKLASAETIILTFGTSIVFELKSDESIAANCHSLENKLFNTRQLSLDECIESFQQIHQSLSKLNPRATFIASISPVRHIRSGLIENNISKSCLRLALSQTSQFHYFPAYEIFIDELRDYRFSKEDLVHPNQQAQEYIWEKFKDCYFEESLKQKVLEIEKFRKFENHKPLNENSNHDEQLSIRRQKLQQAYPNAELN